MAELEHLFPLFYIFHEALIAFYPQKSTQYGFPKDSFNESFLDKSPFEHFIYSGQHESVGILWKISSNYFQ